MLDQGQDTPTQPLDEAILALSTLISSRQSQSRSRYVKVANELFDQNHAQALIASFSSRQCTCILTHEGTQRRIPGVTQTECAAAASEYGLEWDWECEEFKMPKFLEEQFWDCWNRLEAVYREYERIYRTTRRKFSFCVALLILWFLGGPFAGDRPAVHFVVQALGLIFVAYGMGVLRVLQYLNPLGRILDQANLRLLGLKDVLGVNFQQNRGDPVQITKSLTETVKKQHLKQLDSVSTDLANVKSHLLKSLWDAYGELFQLIQGRASQGQDDGGDSARSGV